MTARRRRITSGGDLLVPSRSSHPRGGPSDPLGIVRTPSCDPQASVARRVDGGRSSGGAAPARRPGDTSASTAPAAGPAGPSTPTARVFGATASTSSSVGSRRTYQIIAPREAGSCRFADLLARSEDGLVAVHDRACRNCALRPTLGSSRDGLSAGRLKSLRAAGVVAGRLPSATRAHVSSRTRSPRVCADRRAYVRLVMDEMLRLSLRTTCPVLRRVLREGAFTLAEAEEILSRAAELGSGQVREDFTPLALGAGGRLGAVTPTLVALDPANHALAGRRGGDAPARHVLSSAGTHAPVRALGTPCALSLATDFIQPSITQTLRSWFRWRA